MAWAYGLLFVLFAVTTGAKTYYLGAAYVYLLAAGAVAIDAWLLARPGLLRNLLLASALTTAVAILIVLIVTSPGLFPHDGNALTNFLASPRLRRPQARQGCARRERTGRRTGAPWPRRAEPCRGS